MNEQFENCCKECSNTFLTTDCNLEICPSCWNKLVTFSLENEGKGKSEIIDNNSKT